MSRVGEREKNVGIPTTPPDPKAGATTAARGGGLATRRVLDVKEIAIQRKKSTRGGFDQSQERREVVFTGRGEGRRAARPQALLSLGEERRGTEFAGQALDVRRG